MSVNKYMLNGMVADLEENVKNHEIDEITNICQDMIKYIDENTEESQCNDTPDLTQDIIKMVMNDKKDKLVELYRTNSVANLKKWVDFSQLRDMLSDPIMKHRNATSYYLLSLMYGFGLGFEQSRGMEYKYTNLSERDFSNYKKYCGTKPGDTKALIIAANHDKIPIAQRELAYHYLTRSKDITRDIVLAKMWFQRYAESEPEDAAKGLALIKE